MKMRIFYILCFLVYSEYACTQHIAYNLNFGVRKIFTPGTRYALELRQQVQATPEIEKYDKQYGDFFNEDGFWPIPDQAEQHSNGNGAGELDDSPRRIDIEWRGTTSAQYNYRFFPWFRSNAGYSFLMAEETFRHTFRAEMDYRPMRHGVQKRTLDIAARVLFQYSGQQNQTAFDWNAAFVPRIDFEWSFMKNHVLGATNALNAPWDDKFLKPDRWRLYIKLVSIYEKIHRFTFGWQYQRRLDPSGDVSIGLNFAYEIRF